jgi:hypothetical protein
MDGAPSLAAALLAIYLAGVVAGLLTIDARPAARVGLAAVWPLGPLAFIATVTMLLAIAAVAFPARSLLRR